MILPHIAQFLLWLGGWTILDERPPVKQAVIIAAPHTSNWDGYWALVCKVALRLDDIRFFGKHSLFWFPLGTLLRALGGVPLDREKAGSAVQQAVDMFESGEPMLFALAPEGTRKLKDYWKTGFYRIATQAKVPVVLAFLDFGKRQIGLGPTIYLTGDVDRDLAVIRGMYTDVRGFRPQNETPIRFPPDAKLVEAEDNKRHRTIRSFVRRAGRLTSSQQRALDESWPTYGLEYSEAMLDFSSCFGRTAPVVLEIGFGNGESLVKLAKENPDKDFLGIEVHDPGVGHCLIAASEANVSNLRLINHDAIEVLHHQVPEKSLSRLNLYFPDPWPKKRHHKRRILNHAFLEQVHRVLEPAGSLHIATDWENYATAIDELFADSKLFSLGERREHEGDQPLARPATKFERRGLRKGHRIWDWRYDKT